MTSVKQPSPPGDPQRPLDGHLVWLVQSHTVKWPKGFSSKISSAQPSIRRTVCTQIYLHTCTQHMCTSMLHLYQLYICITHVGVSQGKFIKGKFITILLGITLCIASMFLRGTEHSSFASQCSAQTLHDIYVLERQKLTQAAIISFEANCKSCHFSPLRKLFSPDKHY